MSYDQFAYRKNNPSEIFKDKNRVEKIDFKYINYGVDIEMLAVITSRYHQKFWS